MDTTIVSRTGEPAVDAEVRAAVEQLLYSYAAAADELDVNAVTRLLSDAFVDFAGRSGEGREFVLSLFSDLFGNAPQVRHLISNVRVWHAVGTGGAISASAECRYMRFRYQPEPQLISMGDYSAQLATVDGKWMFRHLEVRPLWTASLR